MDKISLIAVYPELILAVMAMFLLRLWVDCRSAVLTPINVLKPQVVFLMAHVACNLLIVWVLAKVCGIVSVEGIAWATPIGGLLTVAWGYPWLLEKTLRAAAPQAAAH